MQDSYAWRQGEARQAVPKWRLTALNLSVFSRDEDEIGNLQGKNSSGFLKLDLFTNYRRCPKAF